MLFPELPLRLSPSCAPWPQSASPSPLYIPPTLSRKHSPTCSPSPPVPRPFWRTVPGPHHGRGCSHNLKPPPFPLPSPNPSCAAKLGSAGFRRPARSRQRRRRTLDQNARPFPAVSPTAGFRFRRSTMFRNRGARWLTAPRMGCVCILRGGVSLRSDLCRGCHRRWLVGPAHRVPAARAREKASQVACRVRLMCQGRPWPECDYDASHAPDSPERTSTQTISPFSVRTKLSSQYSPGPLRLTPSPLRQIDVRPNLGVPRTNRGRGALARWKNIALPVCPDLRDAGRAICGDACSRWLRLH